MTRRAPRRRARRARPARGRPQRTRRRRPRCTARSCRGCSRRRARRSPRRARDGRPPTSRMNAGATASAVGNSIAVARDRQPAPHATARVERSSSEHLADREAGASPVISSTQPATSRAIGPAWSNDRREREHPFDRHEPVARLEAGDAAARRRDANRPSGVRAECAVGQAERRAPQPSPRSSRPAFAPGTPGSERSRNGGSATSCRTRTRAGSSSRRSSNRPLEPLHGLGGPAGDVVAEHRRPVRRANPGRVEEILDGEAPPRRPAAELGDPDAFYESQR